MMEMTYQLIDQLSAASTTGQTGAKRDAGTQEKSDGSFDSMVRQKRQEAGGTAGKAETENEAPAAEAEEKPVTDEERIAMAAAMLLQPQPEIVYVQDTDVPAEEIGTEAVSELLPEQVTDVEMRELPAEQAEAEIPELPAEQAETEAPGLPVQTVAERPAETAARGTEKQTEEPARFQPVQTDEAEAPKAGPADRRSGGEELSMNDREGENETLTEAPAPEAPVFGYMDASPVKVAAPGTAEQPVELEAANAAEELGARIESALTDGTGDTVVELSLSPANLGKLTVEITHSADGSLHVQMFAATEKAAALLEKNAGALQNLLAAKERPQTTVEVRIGENAHQQFLDPNGQRQNQNGAYQQQQQQRRPQREALRVEDFMSRLRLGLVDLDAAI